MSLLGTVILFVVVAYGLKGVTPESAAEVNYAVAEKTGGECYDCHSQNTPGVTEEYARSKHATRGVSCQDCHEPHKDSTGVIEHEGFEVVAQPTPNNCADCHPSAVKEFEASNHSARSWYAVAGAEDFTEVQLAEHNLLDESGNPVNNGQPNVVALVEGKDATTLGCRKCHEIGKPNSDGSVGNCNKCHLGHRFSLETVRKPETCSQCHMGPDHPQREIYEESPHGVFYMQEGEEWNWDAASGTMTVQDTPAPTCATCHMTGFGGTPGTHNVSQRLKWNLTPDQSTLREDWQGKRINMETVCLNCHNPNFYDQHFDHADQTVELVDKKIREGKAILDAAQENGLLTPAPLDESMEFKYFEMWHHEGRRARFGAMMAGPDYVQWHGIYELEKDLVELEEMREELQDKASGQGGDI